MEISNEELFESSLSDAPITSTEQPSQELGQPQVETGQLRDDHGRFASQVQNDPPPAEQPEGQPQAAQNGGQQGWVPPHRLKEESDARRALEQRLAVAEATFQRQLQEMQARIAPPQPQQEQPDWFVDPDARLQHGVQQALDPVQQRINAITETFSRRDAEREFGADKVSAAYSAMDQALRARDMEAIGAYQRAMQSAHPYGELMKWHQKSTVYSQIGSDPNAWFERQLEERLVKDPQFAANALQKIQNNARQQSQGQQGNISLPPSLNRVAAAQSALNDDDGDGSAEGIFNYALR